MSALPYAGIEAGGTKCLLAIGHGHDSILERHRLPTGDADATLGALRRQLYAAHTRYGGLRGVGVAAFGPLQLDRQSADFGRVLATPKPHWRGADWRQVLPDPAMPFAIDTDVNAAALAEHRWGAGKGVASLVYLTVGTGIGGGIVIDGKPLHGALHPEIGHLRVQRHLQDGEFQGVCPFHSDCLEGLASGPAIQARTGQSLSDLAASHPLQAIVADYLGQVCAQLLLTLAANRIVIGGGVLQASGLIDAIRQRCTHWIGGYLPACDGDALSSRIVMPRFADAGLIGALALAMPASD